MAKTFEQTMRELTATTLEERRRGDQRTATITYSPREPGFATYLYDRSAEIMGYSATNPFNAWLQSQAAYWQQNLYAPLTIERQSGVDYYLWREQSTGTRDVTRSLGDMDLRRLLSGLVVDPMGYRPGEGGVYGWGELAAIYQTTPAASIATQIEKWRSGGQPTKADIAERLYEAVKRPPEPGTSQTGKYPLRGGGLSVYYPQLRTGQKDVKLDPTLVSRLTTERPMQRAQKRRYKGGTRVAGALSTLELGKRKLGG